jgi:hypothetical protein
MRPTLILCRNGISAAAAVVLLTACGGSGDDEPASGAAVSSTASTSEAADPEFCTRATEAVKGIQPAFTAGGDDPAALATALQQASDDVRAIEPPSEIEADWTALADGMEQFAEAFASADATDPASRAALQQRATEIVGELTTPATHVQTYLAEECGLEVVPTQPASPTS